jgi:hypothetical protein
MILCVVILALLAVLVATEEEPDTSARVQPPGRVTPASFPAVAPMKKTSGATKHRVARWPLHAVAALVALLFTGCVSNKYQRTGKNTPPAVMLHLPAAPIAAAPENTPPPVFAATLESVIVYRGPGSWKRVAYWDEYVLTLENHSAGAVVVEEATLTDFQGGVVHPGSDPWELERQSRSYTARLKSTGGNILQLGAGMVGSGLMGVATGAVVGPMVLGPSWFGPVLEGAATGFVVAVPVYVASSVYLNVSRKHDVEAEFKKRNLHLPASLAANTTAQGSLFFRISPGPQRLTLRYRIGNETREDVVDLTALSGLHLNVPAH